MAITDTYLDLGDVESKGEARRKGYFAHHIGYLIIQFGEIETREFGIKIRAAKHLFYIAFASWYLSLSSQKMVNR